MGGRFACLCGETRASVFGLGDESRRVGGLGKDQVK